MPSSVWFTSWSVLADISAKAVCGYVLIVLYIRLSGKRSTSRMNNFDWIVTVAVGSLFASTVILKDLSLADGASAIGLLLALQFVLTFATARWSWARRAVLAPPRLLYFRGEFLHQAMRRERVSRDEILSAVRESGIPSLEGACAVVLEPDAEFSIVPENDSRDIGELITSLPGHEDAARSARAA